jgi:hypothetical protein
MDWIFKKMGPAAALSLVAFTSILNAADDAQMRNLENRVTALEQRKTGNGGMINPPARPIVQNGVDIFVFGEVLVWRAREDNLTYAVSMDQTPVINHQESGHGVHFRGKWEPGFRIGIGYNMPHDGWDLTATWTSFKSKDKKHSEDCQCCQSCEIFQPVYFPKDYNLSGTSANGPWVSEAQGKYWRAHLNLVDLDLGREFFVSKWMTLRPFIGARGMWLRQKLKFEYEPNGGTFLLPYSGVGGVFPGANSDFVSLKNNFWGVGLRAGLDATWGLGCGVSLYSKLALSALWGKFTLRQTHTLVDDSEENEDTFVLSNFGDRFQVCRPVADLALGIRYDTTSSDNSWGWGFWAGWEHHYFWGQNKFIRFDGDQFSAFNENYGDFSVAGVNVGMSLDF